MAKELYALAESNELCNSNSHNACSSFYDSTHNTIPVVCFEGSAVWNEVYAGCQAMVTLELNLWMKERIIEKSTPTPTD